MLASTPSAPPIPYATAPGWSGTAPDARSAIGGPHDEFWLAFLSILSILRCQSPFWQKCGRVGTHAGTIRQCPYIDRKQLLSFSSKQQT
jgi:hypothetical protein